MENLNDKNTRHACENEVLQRLKNDRLTLVGKQAYLEILLELAAKEMELSNQEYNHSIPSWFIEGINDIVNHEYKEQERQRVTELDNKARQAAFVRN